jgi:hypothetical protein
MRRVGWAKGVVAVRSASQSLTGLEQIAGAVGINGNHETHKICSVNIPKVSKVSVVASDIRPGCGKVTKVPIVPVISIRGVMRRVKSRVGRAKIKPN